MKGVILAGGSGSRLGELTRVTNKHLLPVGKKPMIYYPIEKLVEAGIKDIMIVTGTEHMGAMIGCLGSGKRFGCDFTYKVQDGVGGIAQALGLTRNFCYGHRLCVILGDNLFEDSLSIYVDTYKEQERGAMILLKEVQDPTRYGVAEIMEDRKIKKIEEKPKNPKSSFAVTGIYLYDQSVFGIIDRLKPSKRGELEITDVNNMYLAWDELSYGILNGWWSDAGTHTSLVRAQALIL